MDRFLAADDPEGRRIVAAIAEIENEPARGCDAAAADAPDVFAGLGPKLDAGAK